MMFNSIFEYEPGHFDGDGCVFPDPGHFTEIHFNREQRAHLPSNEILSEVRAYERQKGVGWEKIHSIFEGVKERGFYVTNGWERITSAEKIEHAHKVLTRLANLERMSA